MNGFLSLLIGTKSAEATLLHLFHYGETYGRAVARDLDVSLLSVQRVLDRLEESSLLVSKEIGRTRTYTWNRKSPYTAPFRELVKIQYESIPIARRQELFATRRRPRAKGKPVIE